MTTGVRRLMCVAILLIAMLNGCGNSDESEQLLTRPLGADRLCDGIARFGADVLGLIARTNGQIPISEQIDALQPLPGSLSMAADELERTGGYSLVPATRRSANALAFALRASQALEEERGSPEVLNQIADQTSDAIQYAGDVLTQLSDGVCGLPDETELVFAADEPVGELVTTEVLRTGPLDNGRRRNYERRLSFSSAATPPRMDDAPTLELMVPRDWETSSVFWRLAGGPVLGRGVMSAGYREILLGNRAWGIPSIFYGTSASAAEELGVGQVRRSVVLDRLHAWMEQIDLRPECDFGGDTTFAKTNMIGYIRRWERCGVRQGFVIEVYGARTAFTPLVGVLQVSGRWPWDQALAARVISAHHFVG